MTSLFWFSNKNPGEKICDEDHREKENNEYRRKQIENMGKIWGFSQIKHHPFTFFAKRTC